MIHKLGLTRSISVPNSNKNSICLAPIWIIAFSGHRPKPGLAGRSSEDINVCRNSLSKAFQSLQEQAAKAEGSCELHCCVASGADLLAVQIADDLNMPVHVILPLNPDEFAADFRNEDGSYQDDWSEAKGYIAKANDPTTDWTLRVAASSSQRPHCYHDTGLQMLESADVLVAIWDGVCTDSMGGTSEVVEMANESHLNIPTFLINPAKEGKIVKTASLELSGSSDTWLKKINDDIADQDLVTQGKATEESISPSIHTVFSAVDSIARSSSRAFRNSLRRSIWLHFWATVLATITAAYAKVLVGNWGAVPKFLTAFELALVVYAFWLVWTASRRHQNSRWRRSRLAAQISDSIIQSACLVDPLQPIVVRHDELWKRFALSTALTAEREKNKQFATASTEGRLKTLSDDYIKQRLRRQLDYFREECEKAERIAHIWARIAKAASFLAIPAILAALILKVFVKGAGKDWTTAPFVFGLPILLPLTAGLASSLLGIDDASRRAIRYKQVSQRLERYADLFPNLVTDTSIQRVVLDVEDILLDEVIEWHASAESMGH